MGQLCTLEVGLWKAGSAGGEKGREEMRKCEEVEKETRINQDQPPPHEPREGSLRN